MRIEDILSHIEGILEDAKSVPFSGKMMIDSSAIKTALEDIRLNLPVEIKQARAIAADRKVILNSAQAESEAVLLRAKERANELVQEHEITKAAKEKGNEILAQAKEKANELMANAQREAAETTDQAHKWAQDMRTSASNFVEEIMKNSDEVLTEGVNEIRRARQNLKTAFARKNQGE